MQLVIDIDLHIVTQGIGSRTPTATISFKSQDTPALNIYFVSNGVVKDFGAAPTILFGLANPTDVTVFFSYEDTFAKLIDANGNPFYEGFPIFDTAEMRAALGTAASIPAVGEVRTTQPSGEKFSVLDIPFIIHRTILVEGGVPPPTEIPGYPAVAAIELKVNKGVASGYAGLDAGGKILTTVLPTVPLANIPAGVELSSHKETANGYPGLDAGGLLLASRLPVDGFSTVIANGKLVALGQALGLLAVTLGEFTVPAVGANVTVPVTTGTTDQPASVFVPAAYYLIATAGAYQYVSTTDLTHGVFRNAGGSSNAALATVIATNQIVSWSGSPGPAGPVGATGAPGTTLTLVDAETTTGQTLLGSTQGQIKRIIAGSNVTLDPTTTPGGLILNASGGGGTLVRAMAHAAATWTYADNVIFPFDTVDEDPASIFSVSTHKFTVPAGYYLVTATFEVQWTTIGNVTVQLRKNDNSIVPLAVTVVGATTYNPNVTLSGVVKCAAGDTLFIFFFNASGNNPAVIVRRAAGAYTMQSPYMRVDQIA